MEGRIQIEEFLREIENEKGELPKDLHITRMCCALVAISDGEIIKVAEPRVRYCPLSSSLYKDIKLFEELDLELTKERIAEVVKRKISEFGHFTRKRELCRKIIDIPYGASEMMMYALEKKGIDVTVTVCDGAGTVITNNPSLVQGIGARMNGLFYTSPIDEVISRIKEDDGYVVFPKTAKIDQIAGLEKAIELGYKNIAVTINGFAGEDLDKIREIEKETDASITSLIICTTGLEKERANEIKKYADLAWGCASFHVRKIVGKEAKLQIGTKIPLFVLTQKGINFVANYSSSEFMKYVEEGKRYVVASYLRGDVRNCKKIKMGNFDAYLGEINKLPLRVEDEPRPLI